MAEASDAPSAAAIDTVVRVARYVWSVPWSRYLARLVRLVALPLSLVTVPLSYVAEVVRVVAAPLIYLAAFLVSSVQGLFSLLVSLKLSAAAGIGIIAGVLLGATSSVITSYLGMQDSDEDPYERDRDYIDYYDEDEADRDDDLDERDYPHSRDMYQLGSPSYQKHLRASDPNAAGPIQRRVARGLLSQTIHEEDDDSSAA
ncbi:hypothetical protein V2A60_004548 [Cordyceps javanica]|uniref:Uncharacterized protein n=1 Tax=Cordyceps javanica TaxID=43265 RepID=A0A545US28_9HYPO|nr:hypothetical protein IF1G_09333 [Cordyceps javanica]TQW03952.1 hypothetical protein IF2G_08266 [Cordyceps javanica]